LVLRFPRRAAVGSIPDSDFTSPVSGDDTICFVAVCDLKCEIIEGFEIPDCTAVGIPQLGDLVAARGNDATVSAEFDGEDTATMGSPRFDLPAVFHLPEANRGVFAAGGENVAVDSPGERVDGAGVACECEIFTAGLGLPDMHTATAVCRCQKYSVRTEFERVDPVSMLTAFVRQFTGGGAVDTNDFLWSSECHHRLIGTDVGSENFVEFVTDGHEPFAGADVPNHAEPLRGAATTSGEEQAAVAAELEYSRATFGEGEHTESFHRPGVVQDDLLLTGNRRQFGPWVGGNSGDSGGRRGFDDRSKIEHVRERCGTFRASTGGHADAHRGVVLLFDDHFAGRGFWGSGIDPLAENFNFRVGDFIRVWRHVGLAGVSNETEQVAGVGVSGLD
jgi:hypothetical protein